MDERDDALNKAYRERRVGRFVVRREQLDDAFGALIYRDLLPIEVRCDPVTGNQIVTAASPEFEVIGKGGYWTPIYRVVIDCDMEPYTNGLAGQRAVNHRRRFEKIADYPPPVPW